MTAEGNTEGKTETVVVGVDGSPESEHALAWAARYAWAVGARVQAVLAPHYPAVGRRAPPGIAPRSATSEVGQSREQMLHKSIPSARGRQPAPRIRPRAV